MRAHAAPPPPRRPGPQVSNLADVPSRRPCGAVMFQSTSAANNEEGGMGVFENIYRSSNIKMFIHKPKINKYSVFLKVKT